MRRAISFLFTFLICLLPAALSAFMDWDVGAGAIVKPGKDSMLYVDISGGARFNDLYGWSVKSGYQAPVGVEYNTIILPVMAGIYGRLFKRAAPLNLFYALYTGGCFARSGEAAATGFMLESCNAVELRVKTMMENRTAFKGTYAENTGRESCDLLFRLDFGYRYNTLSEIRGNQWFNFSGPRLGASVAVNFL